jgi:hypothetical protein
MERDAAVAKSSMRPVELWDGAPEGEFHVEIELVIR